MADDIVLIYATAPDKPAAETICTALLDRHLIACANIWPGMTALYHWEGEMMRESEVVMILKTRASLAVEAIAAGVALHPYETPAFVVLNVPGGHAPFLAWVHNETAEATTR